MTMIFISAEVIMSYFKGNCQKGLPTSLGPILTSGHVSKTESKTSLKQKHHRYSIQIRDLLSNWTAQLFLFIPFRAENQPINLILQGPTQLSSRRLLWFSHWEVIFKHLQLYFSYFNGHIWSSWVHCSSADWLSQGWGALEETRSWCRCLSFQPHFWVARSINHFYK